MSDNKRLNHLKDCKRTDKPWGYEVLWAQASDYVAKIMSIKPHHRMSLQYHNEKEETIYVMSGVLLLWESDDDETFSHLGPGSVYHVKPGQIHRFGAGAGMVMLMEVSTNHLEDVVRIKDDYKR